MTNNQKEKIKIIGMGANCTFSESFINTSDIRSINTFGIGTIDYMIDSCISGIDYMILDTDSIYVLNDLSISAKHVKKHKKLKDKALENSKAVKKILFNVIDYLDVTRPNESIRTFSLKTIGKYSTFELEVFNNIIYGEDEFIKQVSDTAIIQNEFKDTDRAILVAGLGDYTCTAILHLVVAILNKLNIPTTVFAVKGEWLISRGEAKIDECIEKTKKYADEVIVIDYKNIHTYTPKKVNYANYGNLVNEVICNIVKEKISI